MKRMGVFIPPSPYQPNKYGVSIMKKSLHYYRQYIIKNIKSKYAKLSHPLISYTVRIKKFFLTNCKKYETMMLSKIQKGNINA